MSLARELLGEFEHLIEEITLVPSEGGRFEVSIDGRTIYSKLETNRHVQPGEVLGLIRRIVEGT